ncbi:MAG: hypothetical protein N2999_05980 [Proteobacteria bacterium]|nr:hypothetical protein [Pseudomonadota bacterium]
MLKKIILTITAVTLIYACGGGGGSGITGGIGGGGSGSGSGGTQSININSYSVNPASFGTYSTFKVNWQVSQNLVAGYTVSFYINDTPTESVLRRQFVYNAGLSAYTFGNSGTVVCQVLSNNITNTRYTSCKPENSSFSPQTFNLNVSGPVYAILKTCGYDSQLNEVCDKEVLNIIVGQ